MTSSYRKISGFDRPHVSEMLSDSKISTLESGFKNFRICLRIRRMRVDDSRIRKEKVADSKISGYVTRIRKELAIEDTAQYKDMMRTSHSVFQRMLSYIEQDITRKQVLGGNKVISPKERLPLTISHTQNCLALLPSLHPR